MHLSTMWVKEACTDLWYGRAVGFRSSRWAFFRMQQLAWKTVYLSASTHPSDCSGSSEDRLEVSWPKAALGMLRTACSRWTSCSAANKLMMEGGTLSQAP
jgi:hypothetical protein